MVKTLVCSLLLTSAVALHADVIPALVVGDGAPIALQNIVSVKFSEGQLVLLQTNGAVITSELQPLTFTTVEEGSAIASVSLENQDFLAVYSLDGALVRQGNASSSQSLFAGLRQGSYIVRQGNQSYKVQVTSGSSIALTDAPVSASQSLVAPAQADEVGEQAIQFNTQGVAAQGTLANIDSLTFSANQSLVVAEHQGMCDAFLISDLSSISFPTLESVVTIKYAESSVSGVNPYYFRGITVQNSGAGVLVSNHSVLDTEVEYQLSGASTNGYFRINSDYKWKATLIDLQLTNPEGSVILGLTGKKGTIKSQNGYVNSLCDGASYTVIPDVDQKGAIFSEGQLIFSGKGTLNLTSLSHHAICSDDYVSFENGKVNVLGAAGDAVHANDSVLVQSGTITMASSSDGIDCEGPVIVRQGEKGVPTMTITTTADGAKGIKTGGDFLMSAGNVTINQTGGPDKSGSDTSNVISVKADGNIRITGGVLTINNTAKGGKAMSAGGTIEISDEATVNQ